MIKQNLFKCNQLERSGDEVTARAGVIMFDGFKKAMKMEETVNRSGRRPSYACRVKGTADIRISQIPQGQCNGWHKGGFTKRI